LLVGRGPGVKHIFRRFLALVLHRIEQDAVQFLEHRQHRLAGHRGPTAEHRRDFLLLQQLARLFGKQRPVRRRIDHHRFQFFSEQPALLVPSKPPFLFWASISIKTVSLSVVSLIAMVPDSECKTPTLMVSAA